MQLRRMRPGDMEPVSHVVAAAYSEGVLRFFGREALSRYRPRSHEELEAQRKMFPGGCFVASDGRRIGGAVFARHWGTLGWFSSLAVAPDLQGAGLGKALAGAAIAALRAGGCATVGMETWPQAAAYTAMYVGMGFVPIGLTAQMVAPAERDWECPSGCQALLPEELPGDLSNDLPARADTICGKIYPGLSVRTEMRAMASSPSKRSLWLLKGGLLAGFALFDTQPEFDDAARHTDIWFAALDPDLASPEDFLCLAARAAREGLRHGRDMVDVDACTQHPQAYRFLLRAGFRAVNQLLRLGDPDLQKAMPSAEERFLLGRWSS